MTHPDDDWGLVDSSRSASLGDVGAPNYKAATVVAEDGSTHLVLAQCERLGDETAFDIADCPDAAHEQLGPLPLDVIKRIAIAQRNQRQPRDRS